MGARGTKPNISRIGEKNTMKCGLVATIIEYRSSASVDVQFEDGVVVTNQPYASFFHGRIGHPLFLHQSKKKNRVGIRNTMSNGMDAVIIAYRDSHDIDVQFEDGEIRVGCAWKEFSSGNIAHPTHTTDSMASERIGERKPMNCGLSATIIVYRKYHDIDIQFEDGEIVVGVDYGRFVEGSVEHPLMKERSMSLQESAINYYLKDLGFVKVKRGDFQNIGFGRMELDFFHKEQMIAIEVDGGVHKNKGQFERDIRKNKRCYEAGIKLYRFRDKSLPVLTDGLSVNCVLLGVVLMSGLVDCKKELDEILSSNGILLPRNDFIDFERDLPLILDFHNKEYVNYYKKRRIGETVRHKGSNQILTIIDYRGYYGVDVQFEDGSIAYNKNYGAFRRGEIKHPNLTSNAKRSARLGESKTMNCGSVAIIKEYRGAEDMDVVFEGGAVVRGVTYYNFSKGNIKDPDIAKR